MDLNTTLVKVNLYLQFVIQTGLMHSNTTLVKVNHIVPDFFPNILKIQIQLLLRLIPVAQSKI